MNNPHSLEHLLTVGVLTGSRAFRCANEDSDYDIVVRRSDVPSNLKELDDYHECANWVDEDYSTDDADGLEDAEDGTYDPSIWGPIEEISKYIDDNGNLINLFVYPDSESDILAKFVKVNSLMTFIYNTRLQDKTFRIQMFTEILEEVGITDKPKKSATRGRTWLDKLKGHE